jgi:hypothetical protein
MNVVRHHDIGMELAVPEIPISIVHGVYRILAISGRRRKSGPVQAWSRIRSMIKKARPEVVTEGKLRFAGRLPCRRQVRKMGWPTE